MAIESFAAAHWDGRVLALPGHAHASASLDIDGIWFDDLKPGVDGVLRLEIPYSPSGCRAFSPTLRAQRDGRVLWPASDVTVTLTCTGHDDGALRVDADAQPMQPDVVIVVPVYNAADAVRACLDSVLMHTTGHARLLVIDDASPDPAIAPLLARYARLPGVEMLANARNLGFTATANRGIAHAGRADVVLLNADTEVGPNWLTGLRRAAHARADIATATAVSDNAGAFSVPELEQSNPMPAGWSTAQVARALWQDAGHAYPMLPTGNGFCMYVRRSVFDAIGLLDAEAFPQGYGEENDFCQRASARGLRHAVAGTVFVRHARSLSFGAERREALGRAGMQVLRARWPRYEGDVGAMLFSHERRVLDWRVRRLYAQASLRDSPRPRVACVDSHGFYRVGVECHLRHAASRDGVLVCVDASGAIDAALPAIGSDAASLARWLEREAIELVDTRDAADTALADRLAVQARRLGIAVVDANSAGDYSHAWRMLRSFPESPA